MKNQNYKDFDPVLTQVINGTVATKTRHFIFGFLVWTLSNCLLCWDTENISVTIKILGPGRLWPDGDIVETKRATEDPLLSKPPKSLGLWRFDKNGLFRFWISGFWDSVWIFSNISGNKKRATGNPLVSKLQKFQRKIIRF